MRDTQLGYFMTGRSSKKAFPAAAAAYGTRSIFFDTTTRRIRGIDQTSHAGLPSTQFLGLFCAGRYIL